MNRFDKKAGMAMRKFGKFGGLLLAGTALCLPVPAMAALSDAEAQALRDQVAALTARLEALEQKLATREAAPVAAGGAATPAAAQLASGDAKAKGPITSIGWKGSPQFKSDDKLFKVKGRIQYDAGYVSAPPGSADQGFGSGSEARRIRLGGEGKLGAGFGYKLELELSDNSVDLVDTFVTYEKGGWLLTVGNHNQFQSLDELIGDTTGSTMERAAFTDAFNFERRLGVSAQYAHGPWLAQLGVFSDDITALSNSSDGVNGGDENNSISFDGRIVLAPKIGKTQLHLGLSGHWRDLGRTADAGTRYRQRPYLHFSNSRVMATPSMDVQQETHYGLELAAVRGPWHFAGEGHWLTASRPGLPDPTFFGGYAEVGYFLTDGDSRSYGKGILGGVDPKSPVGSGGIGAVQLNLRYDYLSLNDGPIQGGVQNGLIGAIVWTPINYLRFNLNYGYLRYTDIPASVSADSSFGLHTGGVRVELDF